MRTCRDPNFFRQTQALSYLYNMLIFRRTIENKIKERLHKGRAILIFGPRQAGKTTLSKKILESYGREYVCVDAFVRYLHISV